MYLSQDFDMAKGEFDMLYLCAGVGAMIFSFDKSTSLEGFKNHWDDLGGLPTDERKK